jgi:cytochrome c
MNTRLILTVIPFSMILGAALPAANHGTPAQAKAMLEKALAHYKSVGRTQALADFNARKAPFTGQDLYVFCIGADHLLTADGGFPEYVGQSADLLKDTQGKSVGQAGWEIATSKGEGELQYQWFNPETKLVEAKISYFAKAGQDVCGVGAYNPG